VPYSIAIAKQARTNPHATVCSQGRNNTHFPLDMQQSMRYSYVQSRKPACSYWPFEWSTTGPVTVDGDTAPMFSGQRTSYHASHVFRLRTPKRL